MTASPFAGARRALRWVGPVQSMGSLAPDVELRGAERVVWIDAKYKPHLQLLAHRGWSGVSEEIRREYRADLHQALAFLRMVRGLACMKRPPSVHGRGLSVELPNSSPPLQRKG